MPLPLTLPLPLGWLWPCPFSDVFVLCVGEVIVQGDEGPVGGVAQGVHDHGVTVRHEEKEEEEIEQEVEDEKEEKHSNNNAHVHG